MSWILSTLGSAALRATVHSPVVRRLTATPFATTLVKQVRRHPSVVPTLTSKEGRLLSRLLDEPEIWDIISVPDDDAVDPLAAHIARRVMPELSFDDPRPKLVASVIVAQVPAALSANHAAALISAQVRSLQSQTLAGGRSAHDAVALEAAAAQTSDGAAVPASAYEGDPIQALGLTDDLRAARELATTSPAEAAEALVGLADRLRDLGFLSHAREVRVERAKTLQTAGLAAAATIEWTELAVGGIVAGHHRYVPEAVAEIRSIAAAAPSLDWVSRRMSTVQALGSWSTNMSATAENALELGLSAVTDQAADSALLVAMAAEMAVAGGHPEVVRARVDDLGAVASIAEGHASSRIALACADAVGTEVQWSRATAVASGTPSTRSDAAAAMVWARRGRFLFLQGRDEEADEMYKVAIGLGCKAQVWADVAEWAHSRTTIWSRAGAFGQLGDMSMVPAAARRRGSDTVLGEVGDLTTTALHAMLDHRLGQATRVLRQQLVNSVTAGHLAAELEALERLGGLASIGADPAQAVAHLVRAGAGAKAEALAVTTGYVDVVDQGASAQAQVKASALQVMAAQNDLLPDSVVPAALDHAMAAAAAPHGGFVGPLGWVQGLRLLGVLSDRIASQSIEQVLGLVDDLLPRGADEYTYADDHLVPILAGLARSHPAARPQIAERVVTVIDVSAEMGRDLITFRESLTTCLPWLNEPLRRRASQGNERAIELLALLGDDSGLVLEAVDVRVQAQLDRGPGYAPGQLTGFADLHMVGAISHRLDLARRTELAEDYARRALDPLEAVSTRAQNAAGCGITGKSLDEPNRRRLFERLTPLLTDTIELNPMESLVGVDALMLVRASVVAASQLCVTDDQADVIATAARTLMRAGQEQDAHAIARAVLILAGTGLRIPLETRALAASPMSQLRRAAPHLLDLDVIGDVDLALELAGDPDPRVRRAVASRLGELLKADPGRGTEIASKLEHDTHRSVRDAAKSSTASGSSATSGGAQVSPS